MIEEEKYVLESSIKDQEEIGTIIINKIMDFFKKEINDYISSIKEDEQKDRIFKSICMSGFIAENLFLNIIFNTSLNFGIKPSILIKKGDIIFERIKKFEEFEENNIK